MANQTTVTAAVDDNIISRAAEFCGLTQDDVLRLNAAGYGSAMVLVRYRTDDGDDRQRITIAQLVVLPMERTEMIRDIFPVVL